MNTGTAATHDHLDYAWVFYDAECPFCTRLAARVNGLLDGRGFHFLPLQTPGAAERLGVTPQDLLAEMHLLTATGHRLRGAEAVLEIARHMWWARPLVPLAQLPGMMRLLRRIYGHVAAHRHCLGGRCGLHHAPKHRRVFFEMP